MLNAAYLLSPTPLCPVSTNADKKQASMFLLLRYNSQESHLRLTRPSCNQSLKATSNRSNSSLQSLRLISPQEPTVAQSCFPVFANPAKRSFSPTVLRYQHTYPCWKSQPYPVQYRIYRVHRMVQSRSHSVLAQERGTQPSNPSPNEPSQESDLL